MIVGQEANLGGRDTEPGEDDRVGMGDTEPGVGGSGDTEPGYMTKPELLGAAVMEG